MSLKRSQHKCRSGQRAHGCHSATAAVGSRFRQPTRSLVETGERRRATSPRPEGEPTPGPELKLGQFLPRPQLPGDPGGLATVPGPGCAALSRPARATAALPPPTRHQTLPAPSPVARLPASQTAPHRGATGGPCTQTRPATAGLPRGSHGLRPRPGLAAARGAPTGDSPPGLARFRGSELAGRPPRPTDGGHGPARNFSGAPAEGRPGPARPRSPGPSRGGPGPPDPRPHRAVPAGKGEPRPRRHPRHLLGLRAARQPRLQLAHNFQHRLRHFYCWRGRGGGSGFTARSQHSASPPPPPSWLRAGNGSGASATPAACGHDG